MPDDMAIEVCHDLINRAMRCEQEEASAKYAQEYRDKEAAIRALITERNSYHEMLRSILALCDDSTRASLGPDAPLRAVKKLKADRDSYASSNFECQLAAERREVARLSDDCERLRALLRETTDWLAAVVDMNGKRVADYPALNARLAGIRSATTPGGDRE